MSEPAPIALLYALEAEGAPLVEAVSRAERQDLDGIEFLRGRVAECPVVLIRTGIGKVRAAHALAAALARFAPREIVGFGSAGALDRSVRVGDLVVGNSLLQHDLGVRVQRRAETDPRLRAELANFAGRQAGVSHVHEGTILTGDKACLSWRRKFALRVSFRRDRPLAVDMESAALGAVANAAGIPVAILRVATDRAGSFAPFEFRRNFEHHAPAPARTLLEWLRRRNR